MNKTLIKHNNQPLILIVGGGFGGIELAKKLRNKPVQVLLLDRHNYHTFQPLLYQVATGGLEPDSIAFPLRRIFKGQENFSFRMTEVEQIIPEQQLLKTSIGDMKYDYLVLATGSDTNFFDQKEVEHYSMPMKSIPEALNLRSMLLQNLEEAIIEQNEAKQHALLNFVVVGGGPTGVELSGALAELKKHVLANDYPELDLRKVNIYLIEGSDKILGAMSEEASEKSIIFLEEMGVKVLCKQRVLSYNGEEIELSEAPSIPTKNVLWSAGVKGAVIKGIPSEVITRGQRILVDQYNRVQGFSNIFAIGDLAAMPCDQYPNGHPGVAPVAIQQGKNLAQNLLRIIQERNPIPFKYHDKGSMATVGRNRAVVDIGNIRFQGVFAWFVWMFVHLMTLVGFRNKLVVFVNWVWSYFSYDRGTRLIIRRFNRRSMTEDTAAK